MRVKLLIILAFVVLSQPLQRVAAVALTDVELQSHLNQRLSARIQLLDLPDGGVDELDVRVTDNRDLNVAGMHIVLNYEVVADGSDYYLVVSSREAIREPIMSFLVELNWSAGRLLRNYALIIDPK